MHKIRVAQLVGNTELGGVSNCVLNYFRYVDRERFFFEFLTYGETETLFEEGVISGGMIPKVNCCVEAIHRGVGCVIIMDGRVPHSILMELLTDEGAGTMVTGN